MRIPGRLWDWDADFRDWRHELHQHPEIAFEEAYTSDFVATKLTSFGLEVHRGLAKTGVVGILRAGSGARAIGLRADMDALLIEERTGLPYQSRNPGRMHACGHDGHTTMLLAAARFLAEQKSFDGTVHFIFQPAEENEGGGRVMVQEGLFRQFPCERVFGLHNWPGMPIGQFAVRPGPIMAAFDIFEIEITGRGSHAAKPHISVDPIVIASQIVSSLQTLVSRNLDPIDQGVVSVTQISAGDTWNVIPERCLLRGTTRSFTPAVQETLQKGVTRIAEGVAATFGGSVKIRYERRYPPTVNEPTAAREAARCAQSVVGQDAVDTDPQPSMGAEDFSFMLEHCPGAYIWAGNGSAEGEKILHSPHYDFNDELIPVGAAYWISLVETLLPRGSDHS